MCFRKWKERVPFRHHLSPALFCLFEEAPFRFKKLFFANHSAGAISSDILLMLVRSHFLADDLFSMYCLLYEDMT